MIHSTNKPVARCKGAPIVYCGGSSALFRAHGFVGDDYQFVIQYTVDCWDCPSKNIGARSGIEMSVLEEVFSAIRQSGRLPILFVGSGITKRYTSNKFNWKELLIRCIKEYDENPLKFLSYQTQAYREAGMSELTQEVYARIGKMIEYDFNMSVYEGRLKLSNVGDSEKSPLKIFLAGLLSQYAVEGDMAAEIELLKQLRDKMLTIVTTNYDTFLEDHIFTNQRKVIGSPIFLGSEIGTLIKMHGCVTQPDSMILTHDDYTSIERKGKVLIGKLIHLFTENPVIFLGYSLTDESIRKLLADIYGCADSSLDFETLKERLIFVEYDRAHSGEAEVGEVVREVDDRRIYLTKIRLSDYTNLFESMIRMERITKLQEVLWLKDLVRDLVVDYEGAKAKIIQLDDGQQDHVSPGEVVVAVGKLNNFLHDQGIRGIGGREVTRDIVFNDLRPIMSKELFLSQLASVARGYTSIPVHKYLKNYSGIIPPTIKAISEKNESHFMTGRTIAKATERYNAYATQNPNATLEDIYNAGGIPKSTKPIFLALRGASLRDPAELRSFLEVHYEELESSHSTYLNKLVLFLDMKENKT